MDIKILSAVERSVFVKFGDIRQVVDIEYQTETNYTGKITIEKPLPSREEIVARIMQDVGAVAGLVGQTLKG